MQDEVPEEQQSHIREILDKAKKIYPKYDVQ
jgi:hypothetical protein